MKKWLFRIWRTSGMIGCPEIEKWLHFGQNCLARNILNGVKKKKTLDKLNSLIEILA